MERKSRENWMPKQLSDTYNLGQIDMTLHNPRWGRVALVLALVSVACDKSNDSPAGAYRATSLVTTTNGQATDQLANGSTIAIVLTPEGTTSGEVHIRVSGGVTALDEDLTGTWTSTGSIVDLHHSADTFLRDVPLTFNAGTLVGDKTFQGSRIQLTLTREDE